MIFPSCVFIDSLSCEAVGWDFLPSRGGSNILNQEELELGINFEEEYQTTSLFIAGNLSHFCCSDSLAPEEAPKETEKEAESQRDC